MSASQDTIIALATPPGRSGVALVRISGPKSFFLLQRLCKQKNKKSFSSRKVCFAPIFDPENKKIDESLVWAMKGPKTYTGEDVVEISAHGNPVVVHRLLNTAIKYGARLAARGEFTKRAFLAGRIDLAQAEAVAQLVSANTTEAAQAALLHLEGALSKETKNIRYTLVALLARIEAALDYPDELTELPKKSLKKQVGNALAKTRVLLETNKRGVLLKEGLKVVIAGAPNVGKSSLLNCLVGDSKAIVTEIPGTTRDAIEDVITLSGVPVRLIDTAGLRHDPGHVERIGIEKTLAHVETADLVLFVVDVSKKLSKKEKEKINELKGRGVAVLVVGNKQDLANKKKNNAADIRVSAKTGQGIRLLEKRMVKQAGVLEQRESSSPIIMEARQKERLLEAEQALRRVEKALAEGVVQDLLTIDIKAAIVALGEITGDEVSDEVINHIFDNFCVGK
ncbi:tRNA uridine-5-carboxymethylaminomethyl(34) synthesis GTPase MnmE [Candidatus Margulisiibacteriota bacterium]